MRNPVLSMLLGIFLLGSVGLLYVAKKANNSLDRDLKITRSNADSLAKVTGSLHDRVDQFKGKNDSLSVKNETLKKSLAQTSSKLRAQEKENGAAKEAADEASKKYDDLIAAQKDRDKQLAGFTSRNSQLEQENKNLSSKVSSLNDANQKLNEQLVAARTMAKDNILMETLTRGGKLNLKGRKVRKIVASLNMPRDMKNPTFRIYDPSGTLLPDQVGSFDMKSTNDASSNLASTNTMKIELTYLLSKKIGPGVYKIEMLNENRHVGNLLVRFR